MCGILAIVRSERLDESGRAAFDRRFERSMERLSRRGPDGRGRYDSPCGRVTMGHARLAIQDLSEAGRQPMLTSDGRLAITYNGETYNAPALRAELEQRGVRFRSRSDTEVLLHGFACWGFEGLLARVYGMYAVVIVERGEATDSARDAGTGARAAAPLRVWAAVDHAGMKPLVWSFSGAGVGGGGATLAIASDADALRALLPEAPALDHAGLCDVLSIGYCPAPRTVWRGVHKLTPGEAMVWEAGSDSRPRIFSHWAPPSEVRAGDAGSDERFAELFEGVVGEHLLSDVPVGLFLSAGLDSSSIAVALKRGGATGAAGSRGAITAHTLATGAPDDEFPAAAELAGRLGMAHRAVPFGEADVEQTLHEAAEAFDEPQGFSALLTAARIARRVRECGSGGGVQTKVVLAGDGGDEALAGYSWHGASSGGAGGALDLGAELPHLAMSDHEPVARAVAAPGCDARTRARAAAMLSGLSYAHRYLRRVFPGFHPSEAGALLQRVARGAEDRYDAVKFVDWLMTEDRQGEGLPHPRRAQRMDIRAFCAGSILPKVDRACMAVGLELRSPFLDRRVLEWALARPVDAGGAGAVESKRPLRDYLRRAVDDGLAPSSLLARPKQGFSLRLAGRRPFTALAGRSGWLESSRLVRDGVLRRDYAAYLPAEDEAREVRLFTLCMMAAWYEPRA